MKKSFLLELALVALVSVIPVHAEDAVIPSDLSDARLTQQHELDKAADWLRAESAKPGANKQALMEQYNRRVDSIRKKYSSGDARGKDIDSTIDRYRDPVTGEQRIENTGSKPKDVRADVDLAAKDVDAARGVADDWRARGDRVTETPTKFVNETTDTTLWKPQDEAVRRAKVDDFDAFSTPGGQRATGNTGMPRDERGFQIDNEGKFTHAELDGDLKTQAKSVDKAAEAAGTRGQNPEFYDQAAKLRNYNDAIQAGIVDPADPPDVAQKKVEAWQQQARTEMDKAGQVAERRGDVRDQVRQNFQDSYDGSKQADPEQKALDRKASSEIGRDRAMIDEANAAQRAENERMRQELDARKGPGDAPDGGRTTAPDDVAGARTRTGDVPDGAGPRTATPDAPGGVRGAVDKAGKVMVGVDIMNTGQDLVDLAEGEKSVGEVGRNLADTVTGGAISAAEMTHQKATDYAAASETTDQANRAEKEAESQQAYLNARRAGATPEEAGALMDAVREGRGDEVDRIRSDLANEGITFDMPDAAAQHTVEGDDTAWDRTKDVASGIKDQTVRAGTFVKDAAGNVVEIGSGMTDEGVRDEIFDQMNENLSLDNLREAPGAVASIYADNEHVRGQKAEQKGIAQGLYDRFIEQGATPEEAAAAAQAYQDGDFNTMRDLRQRLQAEQQQRDAANAQWGPRPAGWPADEDWPPAPHMRDVILGGRDKPGGDPDQGGGDPVGDRSREGDDGTGGGTDVGGGTITPGESDEAAGDEDDAGGPAGVASGDADPDDRSPWGWDDGVADDEGGGGFDVATASGLLDDSRNQGAGAARGQPGTGDDGGYVIDQGAVGGDVAGDKTRTRTAHGQRQGDHAGRPEASTGTGDVPDPLGRLADSVNQAGDTVRGASDAVRGAQDIHDQIKNRGKPPSNGGGHGGGSPNAQGQPPPGMPPGTQVAQGPAGGGPSGGGGGKPPSNGGQSGGQTGGDGGDTVTVTDTGTAGAGGNSGASGSGSGGYAAAPQDQVINGATQIGNRKVTGVKVSLSYDAYSIPDEFQILYEGGVLASSGNTSGASTLTGQGAGASPEVTIRVITREQSTSWNWSAKVEYSVQ